MKNDMKYEVMIVEDEQHQQLRLTELLQEHPEFRIAGIASSIDEARKMLQRSTPELVFLDVLLPPHTSFDLLNDLSSIPFSIIFTTSFEEYAVKAFRLSAVDYLLKPVSRDELSSALGKFKEKKQAADTTGHIRLLLDNLESRRDVPTRVALPSLTGFIFVGIKEIVRCESDNTYTTFFLADKRKIVVSKTLKECEQLLIDYRFVRVHNSHVINIDYVSEYIRGEGGVARMTDGSEVDVSRRRKDEFLRQLRKV
jgi:two-component system LytT family response regulator